MDVAELGCWLRLLGCPGLGRAGARRLLAEFGTPADVLAADPKRLTDHVGDAAAAALRTPTPQGQAQVERTWQWLADEPTRAVLAVGDAAYSPMLLESADPPLLLYAQGRLDLLRMPCVAIVGSRRPTPQGAAIAHRFARELGEAGWTVVSGLAAGIDGAAHLGSLETPASTVAVVGTGLDQVYPRRHTELAQRIAREGLLLSEYPIGTAPLAANFPQRNRIIAGLAHGTLVVEAALRSGSLITARLAAESGREVLAVPGSILSEQSHGCHALLRDGAALVESAADVVAALRPWGEDAAADTAAVATAGPRRERSRSPAAASGLAASPPAAGLPAQTVEWRAQSGRGQARDDDPILAALGHDPVDLDTLMARTGHPAATLNVRLIELEFDGCVARLPGGRFQRLGRA